LPKNWVFCDVRCKKNKKNKQEMTNYDMSMWPGRTYRYYQGTPLFPFGFGLSYTTFSHACTTIDRLQYTCTITNTGSVEGDEVLLVYHNVSQEIRAAADHPIPLKQLIAFERVTVVAGQSASIDFKLNDQNFMVVNADGERVTYSGQHSIIFSRGVDQDVIFTVKIGDVSSTNTARGEWLQGRRRQSHVLAADADAVV
jgi:hypothetical protein